MLEIRPNCERCDVDLPPDSTQARICTYECTFCASCVDNVLRNVCPNCGGGFVPRPIRPQQARREGLSIVDQPPSTKRVHTPYSDDELKAFSAQHVNVPPEQR